MPETPSLSSTLISLIDKNNDGLVDSTGTKIADIENWMRNAFNRDRNNNGGDGPDLHLEQTDRDLDGDYDIVDAQDAFFKSASRFKDLGKLSNEFKKIKDSFSTEFHTDEISDSEQLEYDIAVNESTNILNGSNLLSREERVYFIEAGHELGRLKEEERNNQDNSKN